MKQTLLTASLAIIATAAPSSPVVGAIPKWASSLSGGPGDRECDVLQKGAAPLPDEDTWQAFLKYGMYSNISKSAPTPKGYVPAFKDFSAVVLSPHCRGHTMLNEYSPEICARLCDNRHGCVAFNIYVSRGPSKVPGPQCPNPPATAVYNCALYGSLITNSSAMATDVAIGPADASGQPFVVRVRGSNGYNKVGRHDLNPFHLPLASKIISSTGFIGSTTSLNTSSIPRVTPPAKVSSVASNVKFVTPTGRTSSTLSKSSTPTARITTTLKPPNSVHPQPSFMSSAVNTSTVFSPTSSTRTVKPTDHILNPHPNLFKRNLTETTLRKAATFPAIPVPNFFHHFWNPSASRLVHAPTETVTSYLNQTTEKTVLQPSTVYQNLTATHTKYQNSTETVVTVQFATVTQTAEVERTVVVPHTTTVVARPPWHLPVVPMMVLTKSKMQPTQAAVTTTTTVTKGH
ncbi:uncharacterized protein EI97DRAFT_433085 [Westerdykella ornata]|uniref:Apple domain-containing protein n=1 Tax=Westerdykella ornata TaxID=318751 RepID=A0A6A6JKU5_WESOR|nr:uncharacterized protein EI97DRAFT_433085 [Westerdykella ornata]KAF2276855.1 hypothetical protein EI97DRAFT_433085 [Westerdykella ornata]